MSVWLFVAVAAAVVILLYLLLFHLGPLGIYSRAIMYCTFIYKYRRLIAKYLHICVKVIFYFLFDKNHTDSNARQMIMKYMNALFKLRYIYY